MGAPKLKKSQRDTVLHHWSIKPGADAPEIAADFDGLIEVATLRQWRKRYGAAFGLHGNAVDEEPTTTETQGEQARGASAGAGVPNQPAAEWVDVRDLVQWGRNPRRNDGRPVEELIKIITSLGFGAPLIARRSDRRVVAGHTRIKAITKMGETYPDWPWVPVRYVDLTDAECDAMALADNRSSELAAWDDEGLADVLSDLKDEFDDLHFLGWNNDELLELLGTQPGEGDETTGDESHLLGERFEIVVVCTNEEQQIDLLNRFAEEGLECRALMS